MESGRQEHSSELFNPGQAQDKLNCGEVKELRAEIRL